MFNSILLPFMSLLRVPSDLYSTIPKYTSLHKYILTLNGGDYLKIYRIKGKFGVNSFSQWYFILLIK